MISAHIDRQIFANTCIGITFTNPFAARNEAEKWTDTPRYPNLSLADLITI